MVPSIHLTLLHVLNLHLFIIIVALAILRRAAALRCVLLLTEQVLHLIRRGHHLILVKVVRGNLTLVLLLYRVVSYARLEVF